MPIKPTDELHNKLQNRVAYLNRAINAMKKVTQADNVEEFWEAIALVLEAKKNAAETQLMGFMKLTNEERVAFLQQIQDFKFFLSMPDDFKRDIPAMEKDLKRALADEVNYRAKLAKA